MPDESKSTSYTAPLLVYPHPKRVPPFTRPTRAGLHPTLGLANNWAEDFMAPGGTPVYAPEQSIVFRLSGHDPAQGVTDGSVFGWSVYLHTPTGIIYFITHLGDVAVPVGRRLRASWLIGHVGHWPHDPGRSHTHMGITHPLGVTAAKNRIVRVANAVMV